MLTSGNKLINKEARIENTNKCNARCVMCPRDKMTRPKTTMGWVDFNGIVDQCVELGIETVSVFGYGEPLLDHTLEDKISYCSEFNTWITTNASILTPQRSARLINCGLKNIRFSVHAITERYYNMIHVGLSWRETMGNIKIFLDMNKKAKDPVTTHVTTIPMFGESVEDIVDTWKSHVDFLEVWKPHNWGNKKKYRKSVPKKPSCGRPFHGPIQIQADGDVIPCCFLTNAEIVLGNVYENTLLEILTGEKYEAFRELHLSGDYDGIVCEACDQRNVEDESPLLYSNRDPARTVGKTSTTKFNVEDDNDLHPEKNKYHADSSRAGGPCSCVNCA